MCGCWQYILPNAPSQLFWEEKLGEPREKIGNLNGFDYMYLGGLKVPYFLYLSSVSIKVFFHGHNTLPLHGETCSVIDEQTETGSRKLHLQLTWIWGGKKGSEVKIENLKYNLC